MSDVGYVEPNIRYKYTDYYQMVFKKRKKFCVSHYLALYLR